MLDVGFGAARARLVNLTHGGWLSTASGGAYADGLAGLIRVGPFGDVPASKLVRVRLLEPVPRDDVMVLPPRWEATGVMGRLFPVLDADLTMTPAVAVFWGQTGRRTAGRGGPCDREAALARRSAISRSASSLRPSSLAAISRTGNLR